MTQQQADQIILESKYADTIDDYKFVDGLHVYTLENGLAITVDETGRIQDFDNE